MGKSTVIWQLVHDERRRLTTDLSGLSAEQWIQPSLCEGWNVHDVVAHLVDSARTSRLSFIRDMFAARGNFDRVNEVGIARERRTDPQETLAALRDTVSLTRTPPANLASRLVEAVVHGEDIRRPLGTTGHYPKLAVVQALEYQLRTPTSFGGGRERAAGFKLIDRMAGTSWGSGEAVDGDALDLLMAVSGRTVSAERFDGSGASHFASAVNPPFDS